MAAKSSERYVGLGVVLGVIALLVFFAIGAIVTHYEKSPPVVTLPATSGTSGPMPDLTATGTISAQDIGMPPPNVEAGAKPAELVVDDWKQSTTAKAPTKHSVTPPKPARRKK